MIENHYLRAGFWRGCWTFLVCLLGAGCSSTPTVPALDETRLARLVIENRTDYEWTLSATSDSGESSNVTLDRRSTVTLRLPAGGYRVSQSTHAGVSQGPLLVRTLPIVLSAGVSYRWPLLTLLSDETTPIP